MKKIAVFDIHSFEKDYLLTANNHKYDLQFIDTSLDTTTIPLAKLSKAVAVFVNDTVSSVVLDGLKELGVEFIVTRSAGYNHIDIKHAQKIGVHVTNVPDYSPHAVAEHTVALMMALNRRLIAAHRRIMDLNFSLNGLVGFDMHGKTVGIIGMGKIGQSVARILRGFGCKIAYYDMRENSTVNKEFGITPDSLDVLCENSDIITLHAPLTSETEYLINSDRISRMKDGVMLINTSRGRLLNTKDVIQGLKAGKIGYLGLDVYEEETGLFFEDHSDDILQDDVIARLLTFKNVLITSHQAFLTDSALQEIAETTIYNLDCWSEGKKSKYELF